MLLHGQCATPVRVRAGEVLVREGARNRQFVLLQEGTLRVTRGGEQVAELGAGDFVGELSLLGDGTATATVTTATAAIASTAATTAAARSLTIGGGGCFGSAFDVLYFVCHD